MSAHIVTIDPEDLAKPGGLGRLLESAVGERRSVILCQQHEDEVEMEADEDRATCPECGLTVRFEERAE